MRTRIFKDISVIGACYYDIFDNTGVRTSHTQVGSIYQVARQYDALTDVVTPNYFELKKSGAFLGVNPCSRDKDVVSSVTGLFSAKSTTTGQVDTLVPTNGTPLVSVFLGVRKLSLPNSVDYAGDLDFCVRSARIKALSKISKPEFDFAEDVAELDKTVQLLKGPATEYRRQVTAFTKALRKKGIRRAVDLANATSDLILSTEFGAGNLVLSMIRGLDYWATAAPPPMRRCAKGFHFLDASSDSTASYDNSAQHERYVRKVDCRTRAYAYIYYMYNNPMDGARALCGLTTKDIPRTLWNVTKASWFIDQIVNIGGCIESLTTLSDPNITILDAGTSTEQKYTDDIGFTAMWYDQGYILDFQPSYLNSSIERISRVKWTPGWIDTIPLSPRIQKTLSAMSTVETDVAFATKTLINLLDGGSGKRAPFSGNPIKGLVTVGVSRAIF